MNVVIGDMTLCKLFAIYEDNSSFLLDFEYYCYISSKHRENCFFDERLNAFVIVKQMPLFYKIQKIDVLYMLVTKGVKVCICEKLTVSERMKILNSLMR